MPHVDNQKQLTPRPRHPSAQPARSATLAHACRAPAKPARQQPPGNARPLAMRWSTGPDGRLCCAWQPPIPWGTDGISDPSECRRTRLGASERPMLARDPMRDVLAAH
jgi:hypothetical protein